MSVEHTKMQFPETIIATKRERVAKTPPATDHVTTLGKHALQMHEGFAIMDIVDSPCSYLKSELEARIADQPAALDAIIQAIDRSEVRIDEDRRPIASLAFLGPSGVGKSETAKALASIMSGGEEPNLIKIDCSNYANGHEVAALIGSPPGYVGHEHNPILAAKRVQKPGTVILFDEIEKGSDNLYNLMLQIMGDGELYTNDGKTTDFRNTIIVLTSNLGAMEMAHQANDLPLGFHSDRQSIDQSRIEQTALKAFNEFFRPEFINRLSKSIVFHPLDSTGLRRVLDTKLTHLNSQYEDQYGLRVTLSDEVCDHLVSIAAEAPHMGARPLVRALEENVQTTLGQYYGQQLLPEGTHVRVIHRRELANASAIPEKQELIFTARTDTALRRKEISKEIVVCSEETDVEKAPPEYIYPEPLEP